jgi:RNA polymerase sigma-70 factor (ECF subfamily)
VNPERDESEDVAEDVVHEAWLADRRSKVLEAMEQLSAEQREVLEYAYFRGYTQARIALETGVPLGTVKTRTLAAMRRLRGALMGGSLDEG